MGHAWGSLGAASGQRWASLGAALGKPRKPPLSHCSLEEQKDEVAPNQGAKKSKFRGYRFAVIGSALQYGGSLSCAHENLIIVVGLLVPQAKIYDLTGVG